MEPVVVTIARQYGSGGKTIGYMLAEELGISCYDKELIRMASDESGINIRLFAEADEKIKKKNPIFNFGNKVYDGKLISPESGDFVSDDNLFNYQAKVIKELAEKESCVIVGRCADFVLKDHPNVLRVFIHAPSDFCYERAAERVKMSPRELEKFIAKTDKYRADYYKYYTGRDWIDARNYDLCLNSSKLGFDGCVEAIKAHMQVRFKG